MTIYDARPLRRWFRPTLRLRLTLLSGVLLVAGALLLVLLTWLLVRHQLNSAVDLKDGSDVVLADGTHMPATQWRDELLARSQREALGYGALAVLGISLLGVAGAYVVAGRALRPLQQVTTTAQHLTGDTLDQRIRYVGADDEVAELAATFDAMLDRISTAFETQKRFVANASHELRTPLAVLRTEVEVTLSDPDADLTEYRRMAKVVRDGSERANALVDALLVLARSEAQAGRRLSLKVPADLAHGVTMALNVVRKESDRIHLVIETELEPAPVVGARGLLHRLAGNLIENAVRYNHLHGRIWITTRSDDAHSYLIVRNTGFEVDPLEVSGLFEPFRQAARNAPVAAVPGSACRSCAR